MKILALLFLLFIIAADCGLLLFPSQIVKSNNPINLIKASGEGMAHERTMAPLSNDVAAQLRSQDVIANVNDDLPRLSHLSSSEIS